MSAFATFLSNLISTAIFLVLWDQLVVDKTLSIKSWTFTIEPFVERATPSLISNVIRTPLSASTRARPSIVTSPLRSLGTIADSEGVKGTILSQPVADFELERRLLQSLAITCHATPKISNPSIYFKMSYQADQTRLDLKRAMVEKLSC
ncbi:hypothetical protein JCM5353_005036 [Sporobolomyces roseus]